MRIAIQIIAGLLIFIHVYIMILEMFFWETSRANKVFGVTPELAKQTKSAAANQGLYNGFLAAGLVWGLLLPSTQGDPVLLFFFACIFIAGVFGAFTATMRALFFQGIPALIGLICLSLV